MASISGTNGSLDYGLTVSAPVELPRRQRVGELRVSFAIPSEAIERAQRRLAAAMETMSRQVVATTLASRRIGALAAQAQPASAVIGDQATCPCALCTVMRAAGISLGMQHPPSNAEAEASLQEVLERCSPPEILAVRAALRAGVFEGRAAQACLLGIVADCRGVQYEDLLLQWGRTAIELWVVAYVHAGMTPATDMRAKLLDDWLTAWLEAHTLELPVDPPPPVASSAPPVYRQRPTPLGGPVEPPAWHPFVNLRE